jgi:hypothetical protein
MEHPSDLPALQQDEASAPKNWEINVLERGYWLPPPPPPALIINNPIHQPFLKTLKNSILNQTSTFSKNF